MKRKVALWGLISLLLCTACGAGEGPERQEEVAPPVVDMEVEAGPQEEFDPYSEEFTILVDGESLSIGMQEGSFPWGTSLEEESAEYWSSDGFDGFEIICTDGTILSGLREEGAPDAENGLLNRIETTNAAYETYRGVYAGMTLEEVLEHYPEAERVEADECVYEFSGEMYGLSAIYFTFEDDLLISLEIENLVC